MRSSVSRRAAIWSALPVFKQYRERDGRFHFKLVAADGRELLVSEGFDSPREAGQAVAALKAGEAHAFDGPALQLKGVVVARLAGEASPDDIDAALSAFNTEEA